MINEIGNTISMLHMYVRYDFMACSIDTALFRNCVGKFVSMFCDQLDVDNFS